MILDGLTSGSDGGGLVSNRDDLVKGKLASWWRTARYLAMSRHKFAKHIGVEPDRETFGPYYDVVHEELRRHHARSWTTYEVADNRSPRATPGRLKVLVDGVFFQLAQTGIARLWMSVLELLVEYPDIEFTLLDRGGCPKIDGISTMPFPKNTGYNTPADSMRIEAAAQEIKADAFVSTYYTTPTQTPSALVVYDMIPEVLKFDMSSPVWREKELAIGFARRHVCISRNTRSDLLDFYPDIPGEVVSVAHCGLDGNVFGRNSKGRIVDFKKRYDLTKPYFLWVGSRGRRGNYKNASLLFDSVKRLDDADFDIVCTGGEATVRSEFADGLPDGVQVRRLDLSDDELALAYSGALALVYPSLYEGFGMPLIEAMACGCPVITTRLGALGEVAGDAAVFISGHDTDEMLEALRVVRDPDRRSQLIESGFTRSTQFNWSTMAEALHEALVAAAAEAAGPDSQKFFRRNAELRAVQYDVDHGYIGRKLNLHLFNR